MKTILLWDPQVPGTPPVRLSVEDAIASAAVRAGVAAASDPADHAALMIGGPLDTYPLQEAVVQHGSRKAHRRLRLPRAVIAIGAALGLMAATGAWTPPAALPVAVPVGFDKPALFPFVFWRNSSGVILTDYTAQAWAPAPRPGDAGVTVYYVDATRPTDGGDGLSEATAKRAIESAIVAGNAQANPYVVMVRAGIYRRDRCPSGASGSRVPNKACAIIAYGGRVETGFFDDLTWALDQGTTYSAPRTLVRRVVNTATTNAFNLYPDLTWATSLAACRATPGSWFTDNTTLYVNRADGAAVTNANTRAFLQLGGGPLRMTTSGNMFVSGIEVQGGTPMLISGNPTGRFVAEDCRANYSSGDDGIIVAANSVKNGVAILDVAGAAFIRCDSSGNQSDGFNPHIANGVLPFMFTMDCTGLNNGRPGSFSSNGLTNHDGCKAIDLRGRYEDNAGGQVAIVGDGTQLWCIDTVCRASRGDMIFGGVVPPADYLVDQSASSILYLDNCRSSETQYSRYARFGRILNRGGSFAGETFTANGGTVEAFA